MKWLIVVNPHAGNGSTPFAAVTAGATLRNLDFEVRETPDLVELHRIVNEAHAAGVRRFVAVGGDGTAHHVVNAIMHLPSSDRCTLAIIATGSGGDFVRTFGHKAGVQAGLDLLLEPDIYPIDIGRIDGVFGSRYFLNAANAGVAAASVAVAARLPRFIGASRYSVAFWAALARFAASPVSVAIDHHAFSGSAFNVVIANGQFFGGGMNVAPRAAVMDGVFDVQVFSGRRTNAFSVMPRLLIGTHLTHRAVRRYVGSVVDVNVPESWPIEADGELLGTGSVKISVIDHAIDFVA